MDKRITPAATAVEGSTFATAPEADQAAILSACRELTDSIYHGLDVSHEIHTTHSQQLGDTVLLRENSELDGFAVCHLGAGEAGSGTCFIKFGASTPPATTPTAGCLAAATAHGSRE